ncbi:two-component system, LytT family, sensor histidine kinase AlgZ [Solimonas aquatica]|uniref:Two-component system, LytT family, sensor histidine kinase AlgZ n=1 Tax=Solimonas aquatica TaxID=489703 RepID=A0A1H9GRN6_9GAMM|nr:histidine kinase [Solimonas aquatica]SEQ52757.1 two-component system, LytT family, sensor histidine kinase AlgZ [Solimonas aquatica]
MQRITPLSRHRLDLIPNFCEGRPVLTLAFSMAMLALVLTLAGERRGVEAVERGLLLTVYLQWISLCAAATLCWARRWLKYARPGIVFFACWGLLVVIVTLIAELTYYLNQAMSWQFIGNEERLPFILRHAAIAAVVALLLLRYFWIRHQWNMQVRAEAEARYQALNARIRPHFLFNSLNSLAALIQIRPHDAEMMVEDLSDLFRASLEKGQQMAQLMEEISLCSAYLRIEKLRLGDKLAVEWDIPEELLEWPVPKLILQPLIENAVHHGISRLAQNGTVRIAAREIFGRLVLEVSNPMPPDAGNKHGNRVAVDNIAQRLKLIYGDGARLELGRDLRLEGGVFRARLVLSRLTAPLPRT